MVTPQVKSITISEAADIFEQSEVVSTETTGGMLVTLLKNTESSFYLIQGTGEDMLHISC